MIRTLEKILRFIGIPPVRNPCRPRETPDVDFICIKDKNDESYIALSSGEFVPITNGFDRNGDECDLDDAVSIVAGPTKTGSWISMEVNRNARSRPGRYLH